MDDIDDLKNEVKIMAEKYLAMNKTQREEFLEKIGGYPVSEHTWYIHPDKE